MEYKDIDFEQLEQWIVIYNKHKQKSKKKQLLTLIVITCTPLINNISYGLARRSSDPVEDIIQVANMGLIKAIKRYKPEYKNLKTYLSYAIVGDIKHYLRDKINMIRTPREILELSYRINKLSVEKLQEEGEVYTKELLANVLGIKKSKIEEVIDHERRHIISLDEILYKDDESSKTYAEMISYDDSLDNDDDDADDDFRLTKEKKQILNDAVSKLPEKLKQIVNLIYFDKRSQKDIAKELNTYQSNISRLQKKALNSLYKIITSIENDNKNK